MTATQQVITIGLCVLGTMLTRFLPFLVFRASKPTPKYIVYLGKVLPGAIFAMLVVYCLRNVSLTQDSYGLPEAPSPPGCISGNAKCSSPSPAAPSAICFCCNLYCKRKTKQKQDAPSSCTHPNKCHKLPTTAAYK